MLPKTLLGEEKHRQYKRELEISISLSIIKPFLNNTDIARKSKISILEFGSGNGFQLPHLNKIGDVIASDIYFDNNIKEMKDIYFIKWDIANAPLKDNLFDLIYSNHVIEHLKNLQDAFSELKRIGKSNCIYAFAVPTNIWLLLSIPAQYIVHIRTLIKKILLRIIRNGLYDNKYNIINSIANSNNTKKTFIHYLSKLFLQAHGEYNSFFACYKNFRIKNWINTFKINGFNIITKFPLLLYGPSEWPLIPTMKPHNNICSSVLFILKNKI